MKSWHLIVKYSKILYQLGHLDIQYRGASRPTKPGPWKLFVSLKLNWSRMLKITIVLC